MCDAGDWTSQRWFIRNVAPSSIAADVAGVQ